MSKATTKDKSATPKTLSWGQKWARAASPHSDWDQDSLFGTLHWFRQILALIFGVLLGLSRLTGVIPLAIYGVASTFVVFIFATMYHKLEPVAREEVELKDLLSEAFFPAFGTFLLSWVISFNA